MKPYIITLQCIGSPEEGFLTVANNLNLPFDVKRVFWTIATPLNVIRGKHAHKNTNMILIAVKGEITVTTIDDVGNKLSFELNKTNEGLLLPKMCWHEMTYSADAVQLVITDTEYDASDYIRDKSSFYNLIGKNDE
jgi:dTDP-4-dehydrorhamnose 3,5-epimerase-like enzyme